MIKHIKCDIFESGADIICHQVNCQGVMGSGVAKQVKERYPVVYDEYMKWCNERAPKDLLGCTQFVRLVPVWQEVPEGEFMGVMNIFGQLDYGYNGKCYTDYDALKHSFTNINTFCKDFFSYAPILAFPYKFGCARGGGDWNIVYKMIEEVFQDCVVLICEYDGG